MIKREYVADIEDEEFGFLKFAVIQHDNGDEPWEIASDAETDTHETLDQLLFWNLILGGRMISESMRLRILDDFGQER